MMQWWYGAIVQRWLLRKIAFTCSGCAGASGLWPEGGLEVCKGGCRPKGVTLPIIHARSYVNSVMGLNPYFSLRAH
jgi:hypothetical protein